MQECKAVHNLRVQRLWSQLQKQKSIASYPSNMHDDTIKAATDQTVWRWTGVNWVAMHRWAACDCLAVCLLGFVKAAPLSKQIRVNSRVNTHTRVRPWVDLETQQHTHFRISYLNFHNLTNLWILLVVPHKQLVGRSHTTFHPDKHNVWLQFI